MTVVGKPGWGGNVAEEETQRREHPRLMLVALAFAGGLAVGNQMGNVWLWVAGAGVCVLAAAWFRVVWPRAGVWCVVMGAGAFGAVWVQYRMHYVAPNDLAAVLGDESVLVRLEGIALARPEARRPTGGSLAAFDFREPSTYFPMRVDSVLTRSGERTELRGRVFVKVEATLEPFRAGDLVRLTGHLVPMRAPLNPGEFDRQAYGRGLGQAGMVVVPDARLLEVTPAQGRLGSAWLNFRDQFRRGASEKLHADLVPTGSAERDALLKALLLGMREPDLDRLNDSFQRTGLAHVLAISGLHLGILAGLVMLALRIRGHRRPWQGWFVIAVVLVYLVLVEVRLPVLRAGIMTMVACMGLALGRHYQVGGLVALSGIGLLLWRPDQLFTAGFQLSFGVVLGLVYLQQPVRQRWFGKPNLEAVSTAQMLGQWVIGTFVTSTVAWMVATPIVIYHFGLISPLGIGLSVVGVPMVGLILALGYAKMLIAIMFPGAAMVIGMPLALVTDAMIGMVMISDQLPGGSWRSPFGGMWWTFAALALVTAWGRGWLINRRVAAALFSVMMLWLYVPWMPLGQRPALRLDMIAVGDGTCIVMRSGGQTFVFDAGSNNSMDAGRQWIIPAVRRLNIRRVEAIAISHPDIDHFSAVLELVDAFKVKRVLVTRHFLNQRHHHPGGAAAFVIEELEQRGLEIQVVAAGHVEQLGEASLRWHFPAESFQPVRRDNEASMVVRVDVADRRVLLTGDLEGAGMAYLMPEGQQLRADIVELPHHGSYNELAAAFIREVKPAIVLQSSGFTRWHRDRWADDLAELERYVTVRDGAIWVEIQRDGAITTGHFVNSTNR